MNINHRREVLKTSGLGGAAAVVAALPTPALAKPADRGGKGNWQDHLAIDHLIAAERLYRVTHRDAELAECYAPDAKIRTSWQSGDVRSFVGRRPVDATGQTIINRNGGALIHLAGNKAFVESPNTVTRTVSINGHEAVLTSHMRLLYRVEKREDEWKITQLTSVNEYDELNPAIPGDDLGIKPEQIKGLRPSYRWLAYSRKLAGGKVSDEEFGTDRPEEIDRLYREAFEWLGD